MDLINWRGEPYIIRERFRTRGPPRPLGAGGHLVRATESHTWHSGADIFISKEWLIDHRFNFSSHQNGVGNCLMIPLKQTRHKSVEISTSKHFRQHVEQTHVRHTRHLMCNGFTQRSHKPNGILLEDIFSLRLCCIGCWFNFHPAIGTNWCR